MLRTISRAQGQETSDRIGAGGEEAKKCKKPFKSCRRDVGNRGDLAREKKKKRREENVGSVAAGPYKSREY